MLDNVLLLDLTIMLVAALAASGLGFIVGHTHAQRWWENEMILRGHARFHFFDGKWYWNEDVPKPSDPIAYKVGKQNPIAQKAS